MGMMKIPLFVILIIASAVIFIEKTYILLPFLFHGLSRSTISLFNFNTPPVDLYDPEDISLDRVYIPPADEIQTVIVLMFCYAIVCGCFMWFCCWLYSGTQLGRLMGTRESRHRTTQVASGVV
ncbi:uncharacterized protein LOC109850905 [Asparagus officinalis]|uniref:uncharacterized protein LOC109850905 n=1 Tax=Asparagus officinalis TaxID=4686 RepID=UPI00098E4F39|nr:uncharacterized protein LOC109850905 [Asparagus officinalis]